MTRDDVYVTRWEEAAPLPIGLRQKARRIARHIALAALASIRTSYEGKFLRPIYCHYVFDNQTCRFEQLIVELKAMGQFVDTDTCVEMLEGKRAIDNGYFHLSFDDGFRNISANALPILRKHGIPAIVFVPSSLVSADWPSARKYCLETTGYRGVIEMAKWEDLREAVTAGFEVGSHTRTHARFSAISQNAATLEDEVRGSKQQIEERLGIECKYISWPYGRANDADEVSLKTAKESGYRACFGAFRGSVISQQTSRYAIPRHHFEVQWPMSHIRYFARGNMETRATVHLSPHH